MNDKQTEKTENLCCVKVLRAAMIEEDDLIFLESMAKLYPEEYEIAKEKGEAEALIIINEARALAGLAPEEE